MKQKISKAFLANVIVFFISIGVYFSYGSNTTYGSTCFDSFGTEIPCTYDPTTGKPLDGSENRVGTSGQPIGAGCLYPTDCASGRCDGTTGKCIAAAGTSGQVVGAGCLYPTDCASGFCDGATGKCVSSPPSSGGSSGGIVSPTPNTSVGGTPVGGSSGGTSTGSGSSNRTSSSTGGTAKGGLYIPTRADTGLSDIPVTALIRNLMQWLLYIVGFVAIIAFVISGMQYLLAAGSEDMAKKAKQNMQYAMLGVLVALSALIVIRAIQSVLSGSWFF